MNNKYEFTGEEKQVYGRTLKRIRAKISFGNVIQGEIGGWIEKEENLSHNGNAWVSGNAWVWGNARLSDNAWVSDNAMVYGNAWLYGNARVSDDAWVYGNARVSDTRHIISFSRVGGRNDTLTAFKTKTGFLIKVGCFLGTLELFLEKVKETHGNNKYAKEYEAIAEVIKVRFSEED